MQLLLGIIVGIFLTIGAAYVMDSGKSPVCPAARRLPGRQLGRSRRALRTFQRRCFQRLAPADRAFVSLGEEAFDISNGIV